MINISVSRPPCAIDFQGQAKKKKTILSVPFLPNFESAEAVPGIPGLCSIFHADARRM